MNTESPYTARWWKLDLISTHVLDHIKARRVIQHQKIFWSIQRALSHLLLKKKNAYSSPPALLLNSEPQSFILGFSTTTLLLWCFKYFAKANSVTSRFLSALAYNGIILQPPSEAWMQGICGAICGALLSRSNIWSSQAFLGRKTQLSSFCCSRP